jgi:bifunctional non-homologous end joining protein LigD
MKKDRVNSAKIEVEGRKLEITHPEKLLFSDPPLSKMEIVEYFLEIGPYILSHLKDRPLTIWAHPEGIEKPGYIVKEAPAGRPEWVRTWSYYSESRGDLIDWVIADDLPTLIYLVNLGCLDFHPWLSRTELPDFPDFAVFDLDPEPEAEFRDLIQVAFLIKELLGSVELEVYPKTSGARGLHLFLPIERNYRYEVIREFVLNISLILDFKHPELVATEWKKEKRQGKVRIDYTQNSLGKTMAAVYSIRPRPGAPVSCPLTWEELEKIRNPGDYNLWKMKERLKNKEDLFLPVLAKKQKLERALEILNAKV